MQRFLYLAFALIMLVSCSDDIQRNDQAFQTVIDSTLFRGINNSAVINNNGSIVVRGQNSLEQVDILISSLNQTTVTLGEGAQPGNIASYTSPTGQEFSTNNDSSSGEVSFDVSGDMVSGTFNFVAFNASETDSRTFSQGFIFEVPILNALAGVDPNQTEFFTARINTVSYNPTIINGAVNNGIVVIAGNTTDRSMTIRVPADVVPGTYDITLDGPYQASYTTPAGVSLATEGSLTIITNDVTMDRITGDFIFNTPEGFIITDGGFEVNY